MGVRIVVQHNRTLFSLPRSSLVYEELNASSSSYGSAGFSSSYTKEDLGRENRVLLCCTTMRTPISSPLGVISPKKKKKFHFPLIFFFLAPHLKNFFFPLSKFEKHNGEREKKVLKLPFHPKSFGGKKKENGRRKVHTKMPSEERGERCKLFFFSKRSFLFSSSRTFFPLQSKHLPNRTFHRAHLPVLVY